MYMHITKTQANELRRSILVTQPAASLKARQLKQWHENTVQYTDLSLLRQSHAAPLRTLAVLLTFYKGISVIKTLGDGGTIYNREFSLTKCQSPLLLSTE